MQQAAELLSQVRRRFLAVDNAENAHFAEPLDTICFAFLRTLLPEEVVEHHSRREVRICATDFSEGDPGVLPQVYRKEQTFFQEVMPVAVNAGELRDLKKAFVCELEVMYEVEAVRGLKVSD